MTKKILFLLILFATACQSTTRQPVMPTMPVITLGPAITPTVKLGPIPAKTVQLAWFYKPSQTSDLDLTANNFDLFILTHKDEETRDQLRAKKNNSYFLQYLTLIEIQDQDCNVASPYGNQVAYKEGDFCQISQNHPDWFLLDNNGNRITSGDNYFFMDPGNAGYRAFWLERAREMQQQFAWDGLFIDNIEASLAKFRDQNQIPAKYPNDASFQQAINGFLIYIRQNLQLPTHPILGNIVSVEDNAAWVQYINNLDGVMIEDFAVGWSFNRPTEAEWLNQISEIEWALNSGKSMILVAQGGQTDENRQQFALASYLLVSNENTFFRYANAKEYEAVWLYPNYNISLGAALGSFYRDGDSWRRNFEHGTVNVTPSKMESEIKITP